MAPRTMIKVRLPRIFPIPLSMVPGNLSNGIPRPRPARIDTTMKDKNASTLKYEIITISKIKQRIITTNDMVYRWY